MICTEDEAKTKICHRTIMVVPTPVGVETRYMGCEASGCMAWRWVDNALSLKGYCGLLKEP